MFNHRVRGMRIRCLCISVCDSSERRMFGMCEATVHMDANRTNESDRRTDRRRTHKREQSRPVLVTCAVRIDRLIGGGRPEA